MPKTSYVISTKAKSDIKSIARYTIKEFGEKSEFIEITAAGVREGHPHEVRIVKEAPNYSPSD